MEELKARPVPDEVTRVEGCDCGGLNAHLRTCSFWDLPAEQQMAKRDAALERLDRYVAALNATLVYAEHPDYCLEWRP